MRPVRQRRWTPLIFPAAAVNYWLMKSEPDECSIDDLARAPGQTVAWIGVRNYQARNFMRDDMRVGDGVLFYHSSCPQPGIAGFAEVVSAAYPDATQFDADSPYHDPKAKREAGAIVHEFLEAHERPANPLEIEPNLQQYPSLDNADYHLHFR